MLTMSRAVFQMRFHLIIAVLVTTLIYDTVRIRFMTIYSTAV